MNTQISNNEFDGARSAAVAPNAADKTANKRKPRSAPKSASTVSSKATPKSKKDQLVALLSKPNGARISVIVASLGWQAHTVRAALSGLRRQGIGVAASKSRKTGETVYAIVSSEGGNNEQANGGAAS